MKVEYCISKKIIIRIVEEKNEKITIQRKQDIEINQCIKI